MTTFTFHLEDPPGTFTTYGEFSETLDQAIAASARYLRHKAIDARIHIRRTSDGQYMAEVRYIGWNGGRIEVEDWSEPGVIAAYGLEDGGGKVMVMGERE